MFPPGELVYFWTADDTQLHAQDQDNKINPDGLKVIDDILIYDGSLRTSEIEKVNTAQIKKNSITFNEEWKASISCIPRTRDPEYVQARKKKKRIKWTFPISIMAKWRQDNP